MRPASTIGLDVQLLAAGAIRGVMLSVMGQSALHEAPLALCWPGSSQ